MRVIKRDIDKRLLVLIGALLVVTIFLTAFYELKLNSILGGYNKNSELYGGIKLESVFEQLNKTSAIKETALRDKKYLEKKYQESEAVNEKLKEEIESLKSELTLAKSTEEYRKVMNSGPVAQFRLIQGKNSEINKLNDKISDLCLKLKSYNISEGGC